VVRKLLKLETIVDTTNWVNMFCMSRNSPPPYLCTHQYSSYSDI